MAHIFVTDGEAEGQKRVLNCAVPESRRRAENRAQLSLVWSQWCGVGASKPGGDRLPEPSSSYSSIQTLAVWGDPEQQIC